MKDIKATLFLLKCVYKIAYKYNLISIKDFESILVKILIVTTHQIQQCKI